MDMDACCLPIRLVAVKFVLCGLCFVGQSASYGQQYTVSGFVEDASSGERISGAEVHMPELRRGSITNQYGFFSFSTTAAPMYFVVRHVAYEPKEFRFELQQDTTLNITLFKRTVEFDGEIEVVARSDRNVDKIQMSEHNLSITQIETLPVLLGEPDIQKVLQLLPGVQSGQEGSSGLYVRGGREDQNLILLDGLPVYNPSHVFGFFSVFPAYVMKDVKLLKGGFPARYGGRLSSVVDYTMKEGNMNQYSGLAGIGILSSRFLIEGPIKKNRASFILSGRRSFIDLILRPFRDPSEWTSGYFYDLNFKANYIASSRNRFYLSTYMGSDLIEHQPYKSNLSEPQNELLTTNWGNRIVALRWNRYASNKLFLNLLAGFSSYRYKSQYTITESGDNENKGTMTANTWESGIVDVTTKLDIEYNASLNHYMRFGLEGIWHQVEPGISRIIVEEGPEENEPSNQVFFPSGRIKSTSLAAYAEDEFGLGSSFRFNLGVRASGNLVGNNSYWTLEPRVNMHYRISEDIAVKASVTRVQQHIHLLLDQGGTRLPNDLWLASTDRIKAQRGLNLATGVAWSSPTGQYELSLETYWRWMQNLLEYGPGANAHTSTVLNWADLVESGSGDAYGLEVFAQKKLGRWTGWFGYTLGQATRKFEALNKGKRFLDSNDRRHDISLVSTIQLTKRIEFATTWVYGSGNPIWLPIGRFIGYAQDDEFFDSPQILTDFGAINGQRTPSYHRLDCSFHFKKQLKRTYRTFSIGVYNAYGQKNPFYMHAKLLGIDGAAHSLEEPVVIRKVSLLRWIPSLSYQLDF